MTKNKIHLLSTRQKGGSLVDLLPREVFEIDEIPFIEIQNIDSLELKQKISTLEQQQLNVIFTSASAVSAVEKYLTKTPEWKVFCIGYKTKRAVEAVFGKKSIILEADYGSELADDIIALNSIEKAVFFSGNIRGETLPLKLKRAGTPVQEYVVYNTLEIPRKLSVQYDGILFFSPSAVRSYFASNTIDQSTELFAIGKTTAKEIENKVSNSVFIAEKPDTNTLIKLLINHFKNI